MSNKYFPSSSPDEMNEKPKMSADQESALDMHFNRNKTMHASDVAILSAETGLSEEQVQVLSSFSFFLLLRLSSSAVICFPSNNTGKRSYKQHSICGNWVDGIPSFRVPNKRRALSQRVTVRLNKQVCGMRTMCCLFFFSPLQPGALGTQCIPKYGARFPTIPGSHILIVKTLASLKKKKTGHIL